MQDIRSKFAALAEQPSVPEGGAAALRKRLLEAGYEPKPIPLEVVRENMTAGQRVAGNVYNTARAFTEGALEVAAAPLEAVGQVVPGMGALRDVAGGIRSLPGAFSQNMEVGGTPAVQPGFGSEIAGALGSAAGFMGGSGLMGAASRRLGTAAAGLGQAGRTAKAADAIFGTGPVGAAMRLGAVTEAQSLYREAEAAGAPEWKRFAAFAAGIPVGSLEGLTVAGTGQLGKTAQALMNVNQRSGGALSKAMLAFPAAALTEGVEEGVQEAAQTFSEKMIAQQILKYAEPEEIQDIVADAGRSALLGAIVGTGIGGGALTLEQVARGKAEEQARVDLRKQVSGAILDEAGGFTRTGPGMEMTPEEAVQNYNAKQKTEATLGEEVVYSPEVGEENTLAQESPTLYGTLGALQSTRTLPPIYFIEGAKASAPAVYSGGVVLIDKAQADAAAANLALHEITHATIPAGTPQFKQLVDVAKAEFPDLARVVAEAYGYQFEKANGTIPFPSVPPGPMRTALMVEEGFAWAAENARELVETIITNPDFITPDTGGWLARLRDMLAKLFGRKTRGQKIRAEIDALLSPEMQAVTRDSSNEEILALGKALSDVLSKVDADVLRREVERVKREPDWYETAFEAPPVEQAVEEAAPEVTAEDRAMAEGVDVAAIEAEVAAETKGNGRSAKKTPAQGTEKADSGAAIDRPLPSGRTEPKAPRPDIDESLTPKQRRRIKQKQNRERKRQGKTEPTGPPRTYRRDDTMSAAEAAIEDYERGVDRWAAGVDAAGIGERVESEVPGVRVRLGVQRGEGGPVLELESIVVDAVNRGEGLGTRAMRALVSEADQASIGIVLTPSKDYGASSVGRLRAFYRRFGFAPNRDQSLTGSMYRPPAADPDIRFAAAYHGSPHEFERFSTEYLGTGEGVQAYGWGLYFASRREVAEWYREKLKGDRVVKLDGRTVGPPSIGSSDPAEWALGLLTLDGVIGLNLSTDSAAKAARGRLASQEESVRRARQALSEVMSPAAAAPPPGMSDANVRRFEQRVEADRMDAQRVLAAEEAQLSALEAIANGGLEVEEPSGRGYTVNLAPEESQYLLWDALLEDQSDEVKAALESADWWPYAEERLYDRSDNPTGADLYRDLGQEMDDREVSETLRSLGIRGNKYLDGSSRSKGEGSYNYVIFDEADVEIVDRWAAPSNVEAEDAGSFDSMTWFERSRRYFQDEYLEVQRAQEGMTVPEGGDVRRELRLYESRIMDEALRFRDNAEKTLGKIIGEEVSVEDAHRFLWADHAGERNSWIYKNNDEWHPETNPGSGMRSSVATKIVNDALSGPNAERYKKLRAYVRRVNRQRLAKLKGAGLLSDEFLAAIEAQGYKRYVPLKSQFKSGGILRGPSTKRTQVSGQEGKRAKGRKSEPDNVLINVLADYESAIHSAQKAEIGRALLKLVEANPDKTLWQVYDAPPRVEAIEDGADDVGVMRQLWDMREDWKDKSFRVYNGGDSKVVVFNKRGEDFARAINRANVEGMGAALKMIAPVTRWFAKINTSLNPEFGPVNLTRDALTAYPVILEQYGVKAANAVLKATPSAIRGIFKAEGGIDNEWKPYWDRMKAAGGKTSFYVGKSWDEIRDSVSDLELTLKSNKRVHEKTWLWAKTAGEFVDRVNDSIENGVRLSLFRYAVDVLGKTDAEGAEMARTVTIDFNTKGEARWLSAMYMFANASMQGSVRVASTLMRSKTGRTIAAAVVGMGVLEDLVNYFIAPDDDDGENAWDAVPEWKKDRYFMFYTGLGENGFVTIPKPYGFSAISTMGRALSATGRNAAGEGGMTPLEGGVNVASSAMTSFSPVGDAHNVSWGSAARLVAPTFMDPMVEMAMNEDWRGNPIRPEPLSFDRTPPPDSEMHWKSTPEAYVQAAALLNSFTGGNEFEKGAVSVSPDTLRYMVGAAFGGMLRTADRTLNSAGALFVDGDPVGAFNRAPFVRHFFSNEGERKGYYSYRDNTGEVLVLVDAYDKLRKSEKAENRERAEEMRREYGPLLDLGPEVKSLEKRRKRLQDRIDTLPEGEERGKVEAELYAMLREFNRKFQEAKRQ